MIETSFLHDVAVYVDGRVAKVVINGSYTITSFKVKQVTDSTLALNYIVPVSAVQLITQIDLQDASGKVLTRNAVNVPISSDTLILQTILIEEATP